MTNTQKCDIIKSRKGKAENPNKPQEREKIKMKKIVIIILALALLVPFLCSCGENPDKEKEIIGYVIIPHSDGDECVEIYGYCHYNGLLKVTCVDGREITSAQLIVIEQ